MTGESPRTLKPKFSKIFFEPPVSTSSHSKGNKKLRVLSLWYVEEPFCRRIYRGAVQCRRAEKMAIGPSCLKGSSTLYEVKSGPVNDNVNFEDARENYFRWKFLYPIIYVTFYSLFRNIVALIQVIRCIKQFKFFVVFPHLIIGILNYLSKRFFILKSMSVSVTIFRII